MTEGVKELARRDMAHEESEPETLSHPQGILFGDARARLREFRDIAVPTTR
jgi:hypothetical protein